MPAYSVRIESDAEWNVIEIASAATWARAPGRSIRYATDASTGGAHVSIDDRVVAFGRSPGSPAAPVTLVVQIATTRGRVTLHTDKAPRGTLRLTSAADARVNDSDRADATRLTVMLFLDTAAGTAAGAVGGDSSLA